MPNAENHYFALMQAALWGTTPDLGGNVDWAAVMQVAQHHGTQALISDVASQMTGDNRPSDAMLAKMQAAMRSNLLSQMRLKQLLLSAVALLREHGIEPVLLKGFGLALLYPNPSLRQFGDIDLFIGLDAFHDACRILRTLPGGYNWGEERDVGHHYNIEFGNYPMEIHRVSAEVTDPKEARLYAAIERDGLAENTQQVDFDGFMITLPSREFMVFFTFFHAWHHFLTSGVGWRQIADVAMTLHTYHGRLDLEKLRRWLESMQLMQAWQAFGYLMVSRLGLPEAEMPFFDASCRRRAERLYRIVMETGNFKRVSRFRQRRPNGPLMRKLHALACIFVDFFYRARVFPAVAFKEMGISLRAMLGKVKKSFSAGKGGTR